MFEQQMGFFTKKPTLFPVSKQHYFDDIRLLPIRLNWKEKKTDLDWSMMVGNNSDETTNW